MSPHEREQLLALVAAGLDRVPAGAAHVAEDDNLVTGWALGTLPAAERDAFAGHLAGCADCRHLLEEMHADGTLAAIRASAEPAAERAPARGRVAGRVGVVFAVAAAVLLAGGWVVWTRGEAGRELDRAGREVAAGRPELALDRLEKLSAGSLAAAQAARRAELLEQAAHDAGAAALAERRFDEAQKYAARATAAGVGSPRLAAVSVQALRKDPTETPLAGRSGLYARGVLPTGHLRPGPKPTKPQDKPVEEAFKKAVAEYPKDARLRVAFGEFYLSVNALDLAVAEFKAALAESPDDPQAWLGIGLARFPDSLPADKPRDKNAVADALAAFKKAEASSPNDPAVLANVAVCLERQKDPAAKGYWERALAVATDPELKEMVRTHLGVKTP